MKPTTLVNQFFLKICHLSHRICNWATITSWFRAHDFDFVVLWLRWMIGIWPMSNWKTYFYNFSFFSSERSYAYKLLYRIGLGTESVLLDGCKSLIFSDNDTLWPAVVTKRRTWRKADMFVLVLLAVDVVNSWVDRSLSEPKLSARSLQLLMMLQWQMQKFRLEGSIYWPTPLLPWPSRPLNWFSCIRPFVRFCPLLDVKLQYKWTSLCGCIMCTRKWNIFN